MCEVMTVGNSANGLFTKEQIDYVDSIPDSDLRSHLLHQVRLRDCMERDRDSFEKQLNLKQQSLNPSITIQEAAKNYKETVLAPYNQRYKEAGEKDFIAGAMSDAAREYWQKQALNVLSDEELFKRLWYSRNPVHELNADSGEDMFWGTAEMVAREYVAALQHKPTKKEIKTDFVTVILP